jgi:hypothetical protein
MKKVYLSIVYLTVKSIKFHCQKTVTLALPQCGEVFVVTEVERFGAGSSSYAIRKKLFLSSFKFVTHLSCRSCLIRVTLMDSWVDDTGNSHHGFAGPNQGCLILPCSAGLFMHVWMNDVT